VNPANRHSQCFDGQGGYEEDYTRKVSGTDPVDVVRYGLGPRGIESQRVWSGAAGSSLPQTALGLPAYDTHGNNVGMVSLTGTLAHERTYSPWGEVVPSNGSPPQQGYCANLGHRSDPESALTYMRARYYEPTTARFLSEDPAKDGANWYLYGDSTPTSHVDYSGKTSVSYFQLRLWLAEWTTACQMIREFRPVAAGFLALWTAWLGYEMATAPYEVGSISQRGAYLRDLFHAWKGGLHSLHTLHQGATKILMFYDARSTSLFITMYMLELI